MKIYSDFWKLTLFTVFSKVTFIRTLCIHRWLTEEAGTTGHANSAILRASLHTIWNMIQSHTKCIAKSTSIKNRSIKMSICSLRFNLPHVLLILACAMAMKEKSRWSSDRGKPLFRWCMENLKTALSITILIIYSSIPCPISSSVALLFHKGALNNSTWFFTGYLCRWELISHILIKGYLNDRQVKWWQEDFPGKIMSATSAACKLTAIHLPISAYYHKWF